MKKIFVFILSVLFIGFGIHAQDAAKIYDIDVYQDGKLLSSPFTGGLKAGQFSKVDMDNDGRKDLFVFDRNSEVVLTYLNKGDEGEIKYVYAPEYASIFPKPRTFGLLVDFNNDGIEDLFKDPQIGGVAGIEVWRGKRDSEGLYYELVRNRDDYFNILYYIHNNSPINVYCASTDIPGIADVDGDGDIDILSFELDGSYLNYYRNYAVEKGLGVDTFDMKYEELCFGGFAETMFSSEVILNSEMDGCAHEVTSGGGGGPRHAGSTVTVFDGDCDGDVDVLLGDLLTSTLVYLENGGSPIKGWMVDQDSRFPIYDESAMMDVFLSTFYVDINNDGKRDLIVTPNEEDVSRNQNHVWLYLNEGTDCGPVFKLHKKDFLIDEILHFNRQSHPQFLDFNQDGLTDILIGNGGEIISGNEVKKKLFLLENIGTKDKPAFEVLNEDYLDFGEVVDEISRIAPDLADIDGDGDQDLFLGNNVGDIFFYENIAGPGKEFEFNSPISYWKNIFVGQNSSPDFFDFNGDGLLDLAVGEVNNEFSYFENIGTVDVPKFNSDLSVGANTKQLGNIYTGNDSKSRYGSPVFFKAKNDTYLLQGVRDGRIRFYNKISSSKVDTFNLIKEYFGDIYEGERVTIDIADIDNDNLYELAIGNDRGGIGLYSTSIEVNEMVGTHDLSTNSLDVDMYPSVVRDELHLAGDLNEAYVSVYSLQGVLLHSFVSSSDNHLIDVSNYHGGYYVIRILKGNKSYTQRFVKI